jgi:hypothetical protein
MAWSSERWPPYVLTPASSTSEPATGDNDSEHGYRGPSRASWCMLNEGSRNYETDVGMPPETAAKTSTSGGNLTRGNIMHVIPTPDPPLHGSANIEAVIQSRSSSIWRSDSRLCQSLQPSPTSSPASVSMIRSQEAVPYIDVGWRWPERALQFRVKLTAVAWIGTCTKAATQVDILVRHRRRGYVKPSITLLGMRNPTKSSLF